MEADLSDNQKYPSLNTFCIVFKHCDIILQCSGIKCVLNHANHASSHSKLGFMQFECGKCALNTLEKIQFNGFFCSMSTTLLNCGTGNNIAQFVINYGIVLAFLNTVVIL